MSRAKRNLTPEEIEQIEINNRSNVYDWIQCLMSALIVCVVLFIFVVRVIDVKGTSMYPTLNNQDKMLVSDIFYKPKAGDVVVFKKDQYDPSKALVKRVIATRSEEHTSELQSR